MKKAITSIIVITLIFMVLSSCSEKYGPPTSPVMESAGFEKVFDVPAIGFSVIEAESGGYMIAGEAEFGADKDAYIMKVDSQGNCVWSKTYGGGDDDYARSIIKAADGYVIAGTTYSFGDSTGDAYILKTDFNGNKLWEKNIDSSGHMNTISSMKQTSDNGYILAGSTDITYGSYGVYLLKVDAGGNYEWDNVFWESSGHVFGEDVLVIPGGYFITGCSSAFSSNYELYNVITDLNGNCITAKAIPNMDPDDSNSGQCVIEGIDGGYVVAGQAHFSNYETNGICFFKLDSDGNSMFVKTLDGTGAMDAVRDGDGYIMIGATTSHGTGNLYMVKVDLNGGEVWHKNYGTGDGVSTVEFGTSIAKTSCGGLIVTGATKVDMEDMSMPPKLYLLKTDRYGNL